MAATKPMQNPAIAPWNLSITDANFKKVKAGFKPQDMDDKWNFSAADPDQGGNISIHIIRAWTGREFYVFVLAVKPGGNGVEIKTITWEQNQGENIRKRRARRKL